MRGFLSRLAAGLLAFAAVAAFAATALDTVPVPKLAARVTDLSGSLTDPERDALEAKLKAFEEKRGSQVAVLLVPTIGTETIEEYAGRVTDEWKLGRKGVDDGVLLLVAKKERKVRVHTGRGVQGTLTDLASKRIASDVIAPRFRTGDFAGGLNDGVDAIMKAIEGEALPEPAARAPHTGKVSDGGDGFGLIVLGFFAIPIVAGILRSMFGRLLGATATAGIAGAAAWMLLGSMIFVVLAVVIGFAFALVGGIPGGRGARGPIFLPGGFGGGGGGGGFGGGGGGFSGGGGSFDGGGASGDW